MQDIDTSGWSPAARKIWEKRLAEERNAASKSMRKPSSALEQIWADIDNHTSVNYRKQQLEQGRAGYERYRNNLLYNNNYPKAKTQSSSNNLYNSLV
jgi:hypothetical protein